MKLDLGSITFNMNIENGGGTPSWGTALGQNANYNFTIPGVEKLLTSMVYTTIETTRVECPIGRGGSQQHTVHYELASLYERIYVNNILVPEAKFVLIIVKQVEGEHHIGRRTLKYSPNIKCDGNYINYDCFAKIAATLGIQEKGAWFIHSLYTQNQNELHFDAIIADINQEIKFESSEQRKKYMLDLLEKNEIETNEAQQEICDVMTSNDLRSFYFRNLENNEFIESMIKQREKFISEYPLEKILELTINEYCLGLEGYRDSFCNKLEKGEYSHTGFGIGGANSSKFGIYFKKDGNFHGKNDILIDNPDVYWQEYKQQLYDFIVEMGTAEPNFEIDKKYKLLGGSGGYMYLTKLLSLYYPDRFISMSKTEVYEKLNDYLGIPNRDNAVLNSYYSNIAFRDYIPESNDYSGYYIANAIWKYFQTENNDEIDNKVKLDDSNIKKGAFNKIYYGVPGCGKSYTVDQKFNKNEYHIFRTTFHPEYTNSDFVGQIIPTAKGEKVEYNFHPGAFTNTLEYALNHETEKVCLIIEEINRGNASAIFGDIFQLLDRDKDGNSKYKIFNGPIQEYLVKCGLAITDIYIPSNMWIIATMNTSDQNVFTLDTAFKRRWKMEYIKNEFANDEKSNELKNKVIRISDQYPNITWEKFVSNINKYMLKDNTSINAEDKQLGVYFVTIEEVESQKEFAEKILSYLWEDVAKLDKERWFGNISSYEKLLEEYEKNYLGIFDQSIINELFKNNSEPNETTTQIEGE